MVESNGLVSTLLVFDAYFCMTNINALSSTINKCSRAMCNVIEEVKRFYVSCQINNALNTQNSLFISLIYDLPINLPVLVFCERNAGQSASENGPYKLFGI